jgi:hypothetical protein
MMTTEVMKRTATDNVYHHPDFHGGLSCGIEYLHQNYGVEAVREYLRTFTLSFYAPLREQLKREGLTTLKEHFTQLYNVEGGIAEVHCTPDELIVRVAECPAVRHMRKKNYPVARLFHETTRTVNEALCEGTAFSAELVSYDEQTGRSVQRFFRRPA